MRRLPLFLAVIGFIAGASKPSFSASDVVIDLTEDQILIDERFSGITLTLFGVVAGGDAAGTDVVVVVRGPEAPAQLRPKERRFGVWTPGAPIKTPPAPSFFYSGSSAPLGQIASPATRAPLMLEISALDLAPNVLESHIDADMAEAARDAVIARRQADGYYAERPGGVSIGRGGLFKADVLIPADTPVGAYRAEAYAFRNGALVGADKTVLEVKKAGLDRLIYEAAHRRPVLYGFFCVAMSLFSGWIAAVAFRK